MTAQVDLLKPRELLFSSTENQYLDWPSIGNNLNPCDEAMLLARD